MFRNFKLSTLLLVIFIFSTFVNPLNASAYVQNYTHAEECKASYYNSVNKMANGQYMRSGHFTAAHKFAPMGSVYLVTNLDNHKQVRVTITDRGPFIEGRCIDLSKSAFEHIGKLSTGVIRVRITRVE